MGQAGGPDGCACLTAVASQQGASLQHKARIARILNGGAHQKNRVRNEASRVLYFSRVCAVHNYRRRKQSKWALGSQVTSQLKVTEPSRSLPNSLLEDSISYAHHGWLEKNPGFIPLGGRNQPREYFALGSDYMLGRVAWFHALRGRQMGRGEPAPGCGKAEEGPAIS